MPINKKKSFALKLRNYFFTGVIVLIPIGFTLYLSKFLINFSTRLVPSGLNPNTYLPYAIPGIEIILTIIFITVVGSLSLTFIGKKFLQIIDDLFKRMPILRTIYSAIGQMTDSFREQEGNKKSVVLVEYPRKGSWAVGFATKENTGEIKTKTNINLVNVFVPTTPNPTSGFLLMIPKDDLIYLDMTFEEASKFIVSAGTSKPKS
ncbi:DUF502 domain-containing protein [Candidatus Pelagibacter sp.]|nr:DUF502 domain-containing protein [Candidatus Pelagibacter sp.]